MLGGFAYPSGTVLYDGPTPPGFFGSNVAGIPGVFENIGSSTTAGIGLPIQEGTIFPSSIGVRVKVCLVAESANHTPLTAGRAPMSLSLQASSTPIGHDTQGSRPANAVGIVISTAGQVMLYNAAAGGQAYTATGIFVGLTYGMEFIIEVPVGAVDLSDCRVIYRVVDSTGVLQTVFDSNATPVLSTQALGNFVNAPLLITNCGQVLSGITCRAEVL